MNWLQRENEEHRRKMERLQYIREQHPILLTRIVELETDQIADHQRAVAAVDAMAAERDAALARIVELEEFGREYVERTDAAHDDLSARAEEWRTRALAAENALRRVLEEGPIDALNALDCEGTVTAALRALVPGDLLAKLEEKP